MKNVFILSLLIVLCVGCEKWFSDDPVTQSYEIKNINHLFVDNHIHVNLVSDTISRFDIHAPENLMDAISFHTINDTLYFKNTHHHTWLHYEDSIIVTIHFANRLKSINTRGTGQISTNSMLTGEILTLFAQGGSGKINANVVVDRLRIISFSRTTTDFRIQGYCNELIIFCRGRGVIETTGLNSMNVNAVHAGANHIHIRALRTLQSSIENSGNIYYEGNPQIIREQKNGTGQLIPLNQP